MSSARPTPDCAPTFDIRPPTSGTPAVVRRPSNVEPAARAPNPIASPRRRFVDFDDFVVSSSRSADLLPRQDRVRDASGPHAFVEHYRSGPHLEGAGVLQATGGVRAEEGGNGAGKVIGHSDRSIS
ncbi:MAG: hypothetical protein IKO55_12910 [Kiritimatiellae bacterium]|nr:hypothetical protein [Kiritimatiellia bacterium]